jgi:hypothetical protein
MMIATKGAGCRKRFFAFINVPHVINYGVKMTPPSSLPELRKEEREKGVVIFIVYSSL